MQGTFSRLFCALLPRTTYETLESVQIGNVVMLQKETASLSFIGMGHVQIERCLSS